MTRPGVPSIAGAEPGAAMVRTDRKVMRTYPFSDPNPVPVVGRISPCFRFDGDTDTPVDREWTVVELEHDDPRVTVFPEIGGKIRSAVEKSTRRSFIYDTHVVTFRDIAMRGPWTSGGIGPDVGPRPPARMFAPAPAGCRPLWASLSEASDRGRTVI